MTTQDDDDFFSNYDRAVAQLRIALPLGGFAILPFGWAMSEFSGVSFATIVSTAIFACGLGVLVFLKRAKDEETPNDD